MSKKSSGPDYDVYFKATKNGDCIRVKSKSRGGHSADYYHFFERDLDGSLKRKSISEDVADMLISRVKLVGPTEGFIVNKLDKSQAVSPSDVLHQKSQKEVNFTATGDKLEYHWPIFEKLKHTGYGSIIRATMTLHQVCSSRCQFCSTINRNKKDSISLEEAKAFVEKLYNKQADFNKINFPEYNEKYKYVTGSDIRLKGLILSGGGQPNLWPYFSEFVNWLSDLDIDLGLITNGFPKSVNDAVYDKFTWIRLSITPEDASPFYPQGKFDKQYIPENIISNPEIAFGCSYVYGPWTNDDIISRIHAAIDPWNLDYVRFLTDCNLGRSEQLMAHQELAQRLNRLGLVDSSGWSKGKVFHQLKYHGTKNEAVALWDRGQCYLQSYNAFWDTSGHEERGRSYIYPCDSVTVLSDDEGGEQASRSFDGLKWGTVTNDHVEDLFCEPLTPFFDPREVCSSCLFMNNNRAVKSLMDRNDFEMDKSQIEIKHVNFP